MAQLKKYCVFYSPEAASQGVEPVSVQDSPLVHDWYWGTTEPPPVDASPASSMVGSMQVSATETTQPIPMDTMEQLTKAERLLLLETPEVSKPVASPAVYPSPTHPTHMVPAAPSLENATQFCEAFMPTVENNALNQDGLPCYGSCKQASPVQAKELSQSWCQVFTREMLRQHSHLGSMCQAACRGDFNDPCRPSEATDAATVERLLVSPAAVGALTGAAEGVQPEKGTRTQMLDVAFSRLGTRGVADGVLLPQAQIPGGGSASTVAGSATSPPALGQRFIEQAASNRPVAGSVHT